jgi:hypothetical protein
MTHGTIWALHEQASCDVQNPWPGLLQYPEADREFFHGWEAVRGSNPEPSQEGGRGSADGKCELVRRPGFFERIQ